MSQLIRFSVYFDSIAIEKMTISYRNNDISCTHDGGLMSATDIHIQIF